MIVLLDTTVLVDALRARKQRRSFLADLIASGHALATSVINLAEVHAGMRPHEHEATDLFLSSLDLYSVDPAIARRAGNLRGSFLRKGLTLSLADTLIAATAIEHGLTLATDNRKDFPITDLLLLQLP